MLSSRRDTSWRILGHLFPDTTFAVILVSKIVLVPGATGARIIVLFPTDFFNWRDLDAWELVR